MRHGEEVCYLDVTFPLELKRYKVVDNQRQLCKFGERRSLHYAVFVNLVADVCPIRSVVFLSDKSFDMFARFARGRNVL